jgi:hypothetical protein
LRLFVLALALAYVMPAYSVLRNVANGRDRLELVGLKVEGTATLPKGVGDDIASAIGVQVGPSELQLPMTVSMHVPGRCRIELSSLESTKVVAAVSSNGKRRFEGVEVPALEVLSDELCAVLALRSAGEGESRAALERHLKGLKVDVAVSSLGRFAGKIAYIVGAVAPGSPQFWAYKDKFDAVNEVGEKVTPARLRFADDKGAAWDIRLIDYSSMSTGDTFPRVVEIYKGDALQLRLTSLSSDAKPKLDDKQF